MSVYFSTHERGQVVKIASIVDMVDATSPNAERASRDGERVKEKVSAGSPPRVMSV